MKYIIFVFLLPIISCTHYNFTITNNSDYERNEELISIDISDLEGRYTNESFSIISDGVIVEKQIVNDKNGRKVYFIDNFSPYEKKMYTLETSNLATSESTYKTNVRFGSFSKPFNELDIVKRLTSKDTLIASNIFQMEGPAWENDKIAFRNYFDQRNGMDIFGKRTPEMVLDGVGLPGTNYHELSDWGMDILKVGNSLGAGSMAIMVGDTIYPIRDAENSYYQLLADGPIFASFKLTFEDFGIKDRKYDISQIVSIYPGKYFYENNIVIDGLMGDEKLVTGIVKMHSDTLYNVDYDDYIAYYTFDQQTENNDILGMGVMVNKNVFYELLSEFYPSLGIDNTYYIALNIKNQEPVSYRFYAGWELGNSDFLLRDGFENMLLSDEKDNSLPLKIEFKK